MITIIIINKIIINKNNKILIHPWVTIKSIGVSDRFRDLAGLCIDDLAPLRHITAESISEKAILHRIMFIV